MCEDLYSGRRGMPPSEIIANPFAGMLCDSRLREHDGSRLGMSTGDHRSETALSGFSPVCSLRFTTGQRCCGEALRPGAEHRDYRTPSTCTHMATVARNRLKDAKARASSQTDRIIGGSLEQRVNIVPFLFFVKPQGDAAKLA